MVAVLFVLAATLTLLPAVLARLGPRVDKVSLPWVHSGEHRSARFAAWGERLWRRPFAYRDPGPDRRCLAARLPGDSAAHGDALDQGRAAVGDSSRIGLQPGPGRLRARRDRGRCSSSRPPARAAGGGRAPQAAIRASPGAAPAAGSRRPGADRRDPQAGSLEPRRRRDDRPPPRRAARRAPWSAARSRRTTTSSRRWRPRRRWSSASCSASGFLLLLIALQAPLIAAAGVVTNLLATGAAFGVAKLIFQDGAPALAAGIPAPGLPRRLGTRCSSSR